MLRYKNYKLIRPTNENYYQINDLILTGNGSIFHEVEFNKIIESKFNTDFFYLVDNPDNIKSAAVVHITKNRFGLRKYQFKPLFDTPYGGFIGNNDIDYSSLSVNFFEALAYIGYPYKESLNIQYPGLVFGETAMVDLSYSEDDIFSKIISSKRRNMIRKALNENIIIKNYGSEEGLQIFWNLLRPLHDKLGYHALKFDYYQSVFNYYSETNQAVVLLAYKENKPTSGIFVIGNRNYFHYFKGATDSELKNMGQGELLQWEAIKLSKSFGAKYYDLCNLNKEKLPDIYRFKTGISNNLVHYPIYTNNSFGYKIVNRIIHMI